MNQKTVRIIFRFKLRRSGLPEVFCFVPRGENFPFDGCIVRGKQMQMGINLVVRMHPGEAALRARAEDQGGEGCRKEKRTLPARPLATATRG